MESGRSPAVGKVAFLLLGAALALTRAFFFMTYLNLGLVLAVLLVIAQRSGRGG